MEKYFPAEKIVITGNPVRSDIIETGARKNEALEYFGIRDNRPVLLVLGGSLGARTINESVFRHIGIIENASVFVIWQTGSMYYKDIQQKIQDMPLKNLIFRDFINRMDLAYAAADVIISRAGAGTISELCLIGKPVILVPSPNVAEDHQTKNAMALVKKRAARMVKDDEALSLLIPSALDLIGNHEERKALEKNCRQMALNDASARIVNELFSIIPLK
jgi:UDP-N-acetylglucosamine--N-acetylmuramyl-(pentapeptide) pyrophosphoryl-undecaprenol N-acetylglucosamine transferase